MKVLVTGSSGLIGSEVVRTYAGRGFSVLGVDNNMRREFFGVDGDTKWMRSILEQEFKTFKSADVDIRDFERIRAAVAQFEPDLVVHCAAQPSHDKAADFPLVDFSVNATGTLNLLEAVRNEAPNAVFIHMSTNKVYGDRPNHLKLLEREKRYDFAEHEYENGINEDLSIDNSLHSLFGASKVAADVLAQEYGKYFGLKVGVFRGGCLTGPSHSGVKLHGFLSYLVKCAVHETPYVIFGYKGKQVRDQIHSADVVGAFDAFFHNPLPGEVFNLGGGLENSASVLETIEMIEEVSGKNVNYELSDQARRGDHICYYTDLTKLKTSYPSWKITRSLPNIVEEMVRFEFDSRHNQ